MASGCRRAIRSGAVSALATLALSLSACGREERPDRPDARQEAALDEAETMLDALAANEVANTPDPPSPAAQ